MKKFKKIISFMMVVSLMFTADLVTVKAGTCQEQKQSTNNLREYDLVTGKESVISMTSNSTLMSNNTLKSNTITNKSSYNPSSISPFTIFGTDNRTQVKSTTSHPYYPIAHLEITYTDSTVANATGFMVSKNVLITCGHACMSYKSNAPIKTATVYPGRNGTSKPSTAKLSRYYVCENFTYYNDSDEDDYAIWVLNSDIGNTTGWLGIGYNTNNSFFTSNTFTLTGYPGDKPTGTMWTASGSITSCATLAFYYKIDTIAGQSGAPVYIYKSGSGYVAYGINVAEYETENTAKRITQVLFDWLMNNNYIS